MHLVDTAGMGACLIWLDVQIGYLIGFKQRVTTLLYWAVSFVGSGCAERVITEQKAFARNAIKHLEDQVPNPFNTNEDSR